MASEDVTRPKVGSAGIANKLIIGTHKALLKAPCTPLVSLQPSSVSLELAKRTWGKWVGDVISGNKTCGLSCPIVKVTLRQAGEVRTLTFAMKDTKGMGQGKF